MYALKVFKVDDPPRGICIQAPDIFLGVPSTKKIIIEVSDIEKECRHANPFLGIYNVLERAEQYIVDMFGNIPNEEMGAALRKVYAYMAPIAYYFSRMPAIQH